MKTIKKNASSAKNFVVEFKKEIALIVGGTAVAVAAAIVLKSLHESTEASYDAALAAWTSDLTS